MVGQAGGEQLVWGWCEYTFIVLPEGDATYWANVSQALMGGDWREFKVAVEADGRDDFDRFIDSDEPPDMDEGFEPDEIPGHADGDYPPMPGTLMIEWLEGIDRELIEEYGEYVDTTLNGARLDIGTEEEMLRLADELAERGFTLRRDDHLIRWLGPF